MPQVGQLRIPNNHLERCALQENSNYICLSSQANIYLSSVAIKALTNDYCLRRTAILTSLGIFKSYEISSTAMKFSLFKEN